VGFDVLTTCQPSTVWCSRERLPAAAAQPAQGSSELVAPRISICKIEHDYKESQISFKIIKVYSVHITTAFGRRNYKTTSSKFTSAYYM
jgi:hypothetical protein